MGINTAMILGAQNICFSVASNTALDVLTQVLRHGRVRRARIGVVAEQVPLPRRLADRAGVRQASAVRVRELQDASPAYRGGLAVGDVIVALDGQPLTGVDDLWRLLDSAAIGRPVLLTLLRGAERLERELSPEERDT